MSNLIYMGGGDCVETGVGEMSDLFQLAIYLLLPILFFILTFQYKGNWIMGLLTLIVSSVMLPFVVDYDAVYAFILILVMIGTCAKVIKETLTSGAKI